MTTVGIVKIVAAKVSFISLLASRALSCLDRVKSDGGCMILAVKGGGRERIVLIVSSGDGT